MQQYEGNDVVLPDGYRWGHKPSHHGATEVDRMTVASGRAVLEIAGTAWPHTPETCQDVVTCWVLDDTVLICIGCGLDCT